MLGAAIVLILLYFCHPRPVNVFPIPSHFLRFFPAESRHRLDGSGTRSRAEGDNRSSAKWCGNIRADPTARRPEATPKDASVSSDRRAQALIPLAGRVCPHIKLSSSSTNGPRSARRPRMAPPGAPNEGVARRSAAASPHEPVAPTIVHGRPPVTAPLRGPRTPPCP